MATVRNSEDPFCCSICQQVFTVSLSCGHNFCKMCLEGLWSNDVTWKCPSCQKLSKTKPELTIKMVPKFRRNQHQVTRAKQHTSILCDVRPQPKLKASKSSQSPLKAYLTMPRLRTHQLMEPQGDLQTRLCPQHNKPLELFCNTDQLCVCLLCTFSVHKTHEVVPLKEATEQQKRQLEKTEVNITEMIYIREIKIKELQLSIELSNANAAKQIADGVGVLTALKDSVIHKKTPSLVQHINGLKTVTEDQAKHYINELEQEISMLETRKTEVKKFSQFEDKLRLLQNMQISSVPTTKDWTDVSVSPPLYRGIVARTLSQLEDELSKTTKEVFKAELKRAKSCKQDIELDSDSADPRLTVSIDCKSVVHRPFMRLTHNKDKRFDGLFVSGKKSFTESFYFEVVVSKKPAWTVGVAREDVQRKGMITLLPKNGFWTIGLSEKSYYASDDNVVFLSTKCKPKIVGVFVDREEDLISFYDVEAESLIYSFTINYLTKDLQPICSPGLYNLKNSTPLIVGPSNIT